MRAYKGVRFVTGAGGVGKATAKKAAEQERKRKRWSPPVFPVTVRKICDTDVELKSTDS